MQNLDAIEVLDEPEEKAQWAKYILIANIVGAMGKIDEIQMQAGSVLTELGFLINFAAHRYCSRRCPRHVRPVRRHSGRDEREADRDKEGDSEPNLGPDDRVGG